MAKHDEQLDSAQSSASAELTELTFARGKVIWHEFASPNALAEALANTLVEQFTALLAAECSPLAAFSGGSTPKPLFEALAGKSLEWRHALVTLVDERWVDVAHELSNERFIKAHFLSNLVQQPEFLPLYVEADSVATSLPSVLNNYKRATANRTSKYFFDEVILGMGTDGHTASFFPDADNVRELITYNEAVALQSCVSPASQVERVTWSLAALLRTPFLVLHMTGQTKRELFEQATQADTANLADLMQLPIRSVAYQSHVPLHVYYCD